MHQFQSGLHWQCSLSNWFRPLIHIITVSRCQNGRWDIKLTLPAILLVALINRGNRAVEIPCPTCPTWSHFIQDKLKISIYLSLDKCKICYKVNKILYFIFWFIILSSHVALKTVWVLISWLLLKSWTLDIQILKLTVCQQFFSKFQL